MLEDANIKLAGVATDVLGVSGRAMLEALIAGRRRPGAAGRAGAGAAAEQAPGIAGGPAGPGHRAPPLPAAGRCWTRSRQLEGLIARLDARIEDGDGPVRRGGRSGWRRSRG